MALDTARPTVLITGAGAGIGSELVPFFAGTGHNVILVGSQKPVLEGIAAAARYVFRANTTVIACDLAEPDGAHALATELSRRRIDVDILVNNAGFGTYGESEATGPRTEERIVQANVVALTVLTKLLLPAMIARGSGRILNVASTSALAPVPMHSVYGAAKAYVLAFSETLAEELMGTGVMVTSLSPDPTETESSVSAESGSKWNDEERVMSARSVARTGFRALIRGDRVAVPNFGSLATARLIA